MSGFPVTSSCESRVGVGVDEKFHVEHVADVGVVEHQNAFEQDHVRGIYHSKFTFHSENDIPKFVLEELKRMKSNFNFNLWDQKVVAVVDRFLLFGGHLCNKSSTRGLKMAANLDKWSLFGGGR